MSVPFWPDDLPVSYGTDFERTPVDVLARFEADVGEPISRPRTTGAPFSAMPKWFMNDTQAQSFETFYADTLGQGSRKFIIRDSIRQTVHWWKFTAPPRITHSVRTFARIDAEVLILPAVPWFANYVKTGYSTVPAFVADYENDIYGTDGVKGVASDMPSVAGTYLVRRVLTGSTVTVQETLTAGDIPSSQPAGTLSIVGYPL